MKERMIMTVKELKELVNNSDWSDELEIGTFDGDYSVLSPAPITDIYYNEKYHMVILDHD